MVAKKKVEREKEKKKTRARLSPHSFGAPPKKMTVPLRDAPPATVADLRARLLDGGAPLADRYRALFALRNIGGDAAEAALVDGERASERAREIGEAAGWARSSGARPCSRRGGGARCLNIGRMQGA